MALDTESGLFIQMPQPGGEESAKTGTICSRFTLFSFYNFQSVKLHFTIILALFLFIASAQTQVVQHGHAHNDYMHTRPLFDALESGFTSIEPDVFLYHDKFIVSHVATGLDKKEDLETLYLKPLQKLIQDNGGTVYKDYKGPVILMIEFKTDAGEAYPKLKEVLERYKDMLTVYSHDSIIKQGPIQILITGHKPYDAVMKETTSYATIDGDVKMLKDSKYDHVITRYSDPWGIYFTWTGRGSMPVDEKERLDDLVAQAHKKGKQIRFYAIPDKPEVWRALLNAHVDWVNTDKLKDYSGFYLNEYSGR